MVKFIPKSLKRSKAFVALASAFIFLGFDEVVNPFLRMLDGVELGVGSRIEVSTPLHLNDSKFGQVVYLSADEVKLSAPLYVYGKTLVIETRRLIFEGSGEIQSFPKDFIPRPPQERRELPKGKDGALNSAIRYKLDENEWVTKYAFGKKVTITKDEPSQPKKPPRKPITETLIYSSRWPDRILIDAKGNYLTHPETGADLTSHQVNSNNQKDPTGHFHRFYYETNPDGSYKAITQNAAQGDGGQMMMLSYKAEVSKYEERGETGKTPEETHSADELYRWGLGSEGSKGLDAGRVELYVAKIDGPLKISGRGQIGAQGGKGAKGGKGGTGGKGRDGKKKVLGMGGRSPTRGGFGGDGGKGGEGGKGGQGGRGLELVIYSAQEIDLSLTDVRGGEPGPAGPGGDPGDPGDAGVGGSRSSSWYSFSAPSRAADGIAGKSGSAGKAGKVGTPGAKVDVRVEALKDLEDLRQTTVQSWKQFHLVRSFWVLAEKTYALIDESLLDTNLQEGRIDRPMIDGNAEVLIKAQLESERKIESIRESWKFFVNTFDPSAVPQVTEQSNGSKETLELYKPLHKAGSLILSSLETWNTQKSNVDLLTTVQQSIEQINQLRFNHLLSSLAQAGTSCATYLDAVKPFVEKLNSAPERRALHLVSRHFEIPVCYKADSFQMRPLDTIELQLIFGNVLVPEEHLKPLLRIENAEIYRPVFKNPFSALFRWTSFADDLNDDLDPLIGAEWGLAKPTQVSMEHLAGAFGTSEAVVPGGTLKSLHSTWSKTVNSPEQLHLAVQILTNGWKAWVHQSASRAKERK